jgi:hypothetical protein
MLRQRKTVWLTTAAGLAMLVVSFRLARPGAGASATWLSGLLVNVASAVLLLVPLVLVTFRLERDIESVREETVATVDQVRAETVSSVEALTERVSSFEGDVERRLEDLVSSVSAWLKEERDRDAAIRQTLREKEVTWQGLLETLDRATDQGLISPSRSGRWQDPWAPASPSHPPRVAAGSNPWGTYVSVRAGGDPEASRRQLYFDVETFEGKTIQAVEWARDEPLSEAMVRVGRIAEGASGEQFEPGQLFTGLSELLEVASSAPERRPIVQLCPPQWAVTTRGVVPYGRKDVRVWSHEHIRSNSRIEQDMASKPWLEEESFSLAHAVSRLLFPEEPPF